MMKQKIKIKLLELLFSYILPIIFVSIKYDLFVKSEAGIKLSGVALIIVIILGVKFYANINEMVKKIKNSQTRKIINVTKNVIICFILVLFLEMSREQISNLEFIIAFCGISISVGNCFKEDYVELIKQEQKDERKQEIIDAYNEAVKK